MAGHEIRQFTVHTNILYSIIKSQAGTLAKALLEGCMNAIDAGATRFLVTLTNSGFVISDDGKGFQNKEQVLNWFGQFGTPHVEGDAIYGKFRMGRGQLMAFARTVWRTGEFEMGVDIRDKGLDYTLTEKLRLKKGCKVTGTLYKPMSDAELADVITEFKMQVKYSQIPVNLNGKVVSKKAADLTWDLETDDAYIKITRGDSEKLEVHNLGVFVRDFASYDYGCGGVVVSKKPLQVNFARNDILTSECDTWRRISKYIKQANMAKVAKKGSLNKDERSFLARRFAYGELSNANVDGNNLKIITDITGRHHSVNDMLKARRISVAKESQGRTGYMLHKTGSAFIISEETMRRFSCYSLEEFLDTIKDRGNISEDACPVGVKFDKLAEDFSEDFTTLGLGALPMEERLVFEVLSLYHQRFFDWFSMQEKSSGIRELRAGDSNVARAWTNGTDYVTICHKELKKVVKRGAAGFMDLLTLLVHEYVHDSSDIESHEHDFVYFNKYHDILEYGGTGKLLILALEMDKSLTKMMEKAKCLPEKACANAAKAKSGERKMSVAQAHAWALKNRQLELTM